MHCSAPPLRGVPHYILPGEHRAADQGGKLAFNLDLKAFPCHFGMYRNAMDQSPEIGDKWPPPRRAHAPLRDENERLRLEREILKKRCTFYRERRSEILPHRGPARDILGSLTPFGRCAASWFRFN